jgi:hypothetical protein
MGKYKHRGKLTKISPNGTVTELEFEVDGQPMKITYFTSKPIQFELKEGEEYYFNTSSYKEYTNLKPTWSGKVITGYEIKNAKDLEQNEFFEVDETVKAAPARKTGQQNEYWDRKEMRDVQNQLSARYGGFSHDAVALVIAYKPKYKTIDDAVAAVVVITKKLVEAAKNGDG